MFGGLTLFNPWVLLALVAMLSTAYFVGDHMGTVSADRTAEIKRLEGKIEDYEVKAAAAELIRQVLKRQFDEARALAADAQADRDKAQANATLYKEKVDALVATEETRDHRTGDLFDNGDVDRLRPLAEGAAAPARGGPERRAVEAPRLRPAGGGAAAPSGAK